MQVGYRVKIPSWSQIWQSVRLWAEEQDPGTSGFSSNGKTASTLKKDTAMPTLRLV